MSEDGVRVPSVRQAEALFDHQARTLLGISGDEFLRRWDAGEYQRPLSPEEARKIRRLDILLPFARRTTIKER